MWGNLFPGGLYAQAQGTALGLDAWSPANTRGPTQARFCFLGNRTRRIAQLWAAVWSFNATAAEAAALSPAAAASLVNRSGLPRVHPRVRIVLSSQAVNADVTGRVLGCNGTGFYVDAVAIAPYFSAPLTAGNSGSDADLLPLADLVAGLAANIASWPAKIAQHRAAAAPYGRLPLVAYEAGQGLDANTYIQDSLAMAANAAPDMASLYGAYLAALRGANMSGPLCIFSSAGLPSQYGSWGSLPAPDTNTLSLAADPVVPGGMPAVKWWALRADAAGQAISAAATPDGASFAVTASPAPPGARGVGATCAWNASAAAPSVGAFAAAAVAPPPPPPGSCPAAASQSFADALAGVSPPMGTPLVPCAGHGECALWPGPACVCFEGWMGAACATPKPIVRSTCPYQCNGLGTCVLQQTQGYTQMFGCACNPGYAGDGCQIFSCPGHCSWNGRCVGSNACTCYPGFAGAACDIDCGCGKRGQCALAGAAGANASLVARYATAAAAPGAPAAASLPPTCACDAGYAFSRDGGAIAVNTSRPVGGASRALVWSVSLFATGSCAPVCACPDPAQTCVRPGVCSCLPSCAFGDCINGACACWTGYGGSSCSQPLRPSVAAQLSSPAGGSLLSSRFSPVGMNVAGERRRG